MHLSTDLKSNIILIGISTKGWKRYCPFGLKMLDKLKRSFRRYEVKLGDALGDSGHRSRKTVKKVGKMVEDL